MDLGLKDKRALVTGASRGLGYAVAKALSAEGCLVAINSRSQERINASTEQLARETHGSVVGLAGDVSQPSVPEVLVRQAVEKLRGLDILV